MHDPHPVSAVPAVEPLPEGLLSRYPAVTFVLPFAVYLLVGWAESSPSIPAGEAAGGTGGWLGLPAYPLVYTLKIALTLAAMAVVLPGYRTFARRVSPLALLFGLAGGVAWIALSELGIERRLLTVLGLDGWMSLGARPAFNPLEQLSADPRLAWGFLTVRFVGLVLVVPVIEEFFLRGFLMRFVSEPRWWSLPLASVSRTGLVAGSVVPALYHPEILAALVWFSAVSWLMLRTSNIWDCVTAHAMTNLVLGIYVVSADRWSLM
jgi:CAAX prenyl protease-like protein